MNEQMNEQMNNQINLCPETNFHIWIKSLSTLNHKGYRYNRSDRYD